MSNNIINRLTLDAKDYYGNVKKVIAANERMKNSAKGVDKEIKKMQTIFNSVRLAVMRLGASLLNIAKHPFQSVISGSKKVAKGLLGMATAMKHAVFEFAKFAKQSISKTFNRLEVSLNRLATIGKRAAIASAGLLVVLGKLTAEVEDINNAFVVAFGQNSNEVEDWTKDTAKALRRSSVDLKNYTTGFKVVFKPYIDGMDLTVKATNNMSKELTKRALDLASFLPNVEDVRVFGAIKSGLVGNTKALRALNVDLTENTVQNYLNKHAIDKNIKTMAFSEKVYYRYKTLMENTSYVMGDAAKTAYQLENSGKALASVWKKDVAIAFGSIATPLMTTFLNKLIDLGHYMVALPLGTKKTILKIVILGGVIGTATVALAAFVGLIGTVARTLALVFVPFKLIAGLFSVLGSSGLLLMGVFALIIRYAKKAFPDLSKTVGKAIVDIVKYFGDLKDVYDEGGLGAVFTKIKEDIKKIDWEKNLKEPAVKAFEAMKKDFVKINTFIDSVDWEAMGKSFGENLKKVLIGAFKLIKVALPIAMDIVAKVGTIAWEFAKGAFLGLTEELREHLKNAFESSIQDFMNTDIMIQLRHLVDKIRNTFGLASKEAVFGEIKGTEKTGQLTETPNTGGSAIGFDRGGFTGYGTKMQPAGVVHKGEYVIPQSMVKRYPELIASLEQRRKKGYAGGGTTEPASVRSYRGANEIKPSGKVIKDLNPQVKFLTDLTLAIGKLFGKSEQANTVVTFLKTHIGDLVHSFQIGDEELKQWTERFEKAMKSLQRPAYEKSIERISKLEIALGKSYNANSARINALTTEITRLVDEGADPASEKISELRSELEDLSISLEDTIDNLTKNLSDLGSQVGGTFEEVANAMVTLKEGYTKGKAGVSDIKSGAKLMEGGSSLKGALTMASGALGVASGVMSAVNLWQDHKAKQEAELLQQQKEANEVIAKAAQDFKDAASKGSSTAYREAAAKIKTQSEGVTRSENILKNSGVSDYSGTEELGDWARVAGLSAIHPLLMAAGAVANIFKGKKNVKELDKLEDSLKKSLTDAGFTQAEAGKLMIEKSMSASERIAYGGKRGHKLDVDETMKAIQNEYTRLAQVVQTAKTTLSEEERAFADALKIGIENVKGAIVDAMSASTLEEFKNNANEALDAMVRAAVIQGTIDAESAKIKDYVDNFVGAMTNDDKIVDEHGNTLSEMTKEELEQSKTKKEALIASFEATYEATKSLFELGNTANKVADALNTLPNGIKVAYHRFQASNLLAESVSSQQVSSSINNSVANNQISYLNGIAAPTEPSNKTSGGISFENPASKGSTIINLTVEGNVISEGDLVNKVANEVGIVINKNNRRRY